MSVLIYSENAGGQFKKSSFEAVSYARAIADKTNTTLTAISIGDVANDQLNLLGKYGADKVLNVSSAQLKNFVNQAYASVIASAAKKEGADIVVLSNSFSGRGLAPRIGVKLEAGVADGDIDDGRTIASLLPGAAIGDRSRRPARALDQECVGAAGGGRIGERRPGLDDQRRAAVQVDDVVEVVAGPRRWAGALKVQRASAQGQRRTAGKGRTGLRLGLRSGPAAGLGAAAGETDRSRHRQQPAACQRPAGLRQARRRRAGV